MLGLPDDVTACLFDLDGVLTHTAAVHNRARTEMVVGVDRIGHADDLRGHGADLVVTDLAGLLEGADR